MRKETFMLMISMLAHPSLALKIILRAAKTVNHVRKLREKKTALSQQELAKIEPEQWHLDLMPNLPELLNKEPAAALDEIERMEGLILQTGAIIRATQLAETSWSESDLRFDICDEFDQKSVKLLCKAAAEERLTTIEELDEVLRQAAVANSQQMSYEASERPPAGLVRGTGNSQAGLACDKTKRKYSEIKNYTHMKTQFDELCMKERMEQLIHLVTEE